MSTGQQRRLNAPSARVRPAFVLVLSLVGLLAGLLLAELGLRAAALFAAQPVVAESRYRPMEGYYTYRPNASFDYVNEAGERVVTRTDERGLRNPTGYFDDAEVLLTGDSFIAAVNTPEGATLAARLRDAGLKTYNAGVDGTGTFQQLRLLRSLTAEFRGRAIVVGFYLGNDFRDNYWERPIADSAAYKPSGTGFALDPRIAAACSYIAVCRLLRDRLVIGHIQGQASDPMGSYALSEMLLIRAVGRAIGVALENSRLALDEISRMARDRRQQLIILGIPSKASVLGSFREIASFANDPRAVDFAMETVHAGYSWNRPDDELAAICSDLGIQYVSLLKPFRAAHPGRLFYDFDVHWTAAGQALAAEIVAVAVRASLTKTAD